jgi:chromosome segregation ATPase
MNFKVVIGATLAALAVAGWLAASVVSSARVELKFAEAATKAALKQSDAALAAADAAGKQVVALRAQRDSALVKADRQSRLATRLTGQLAQIEKTAPDTCRPIIITADSALAAKDSEIAQKDSALQAEQKIEQRVQFEADTLRAALTRLSSAAKTEVKAETKVTHRSLLAKLIPTPGIGVAAGFNPSGSPQVITGITLGWHLN